MIRIQARKSDLQAKVGVADQKSELQPGRPPESEPNHREKGPEWGLGAFTENSLKAFLNPPKLCVCICVYIYISLSLSRKLLHSQSKSKFPNEETKGFIPNLGRALNTEGEGGEEPLSSPPQLPLSHPGIL